MTKTLSMRLLESDLDVWWNSITIWRGFWAVELLPKETHLHQRLKSLAPSMLEMSIGSSLGATKSSLQASILPRCMSWQKKGRIMSINTKYWSVYAYKTDDAFILRSLDSQEIYKYKINRISTSYSKIIIKCGMRGTRGMVAAYPTYRPARDRGAGSAGWDVAGRSPSRIRAGSSCAWERIVAQVWTAYSSVRQNECWVDDTMRENDGRWQQGTTG